jgi:hypothetical protein
MDKTKKRKGDEAEKFVADVLKERGYLVEIHPRTFRIIYIHGKPIQVSKDNDYYNLFDVKAEASGHMLYAQVKFENEKANVSTAQKDIDRDFPYEFGYQKIQTWQVWDEWIKPEKGRKHKEFRYRIQERRGFTDKFWRNTERKKGNWITVDISSLNEPIQKSGKMEEIEE